MPCVRTATPDDASSLAKFAERSFRGAFENSNTREDMDLYCAASFGTDLQRNEIERESDTTLLCEDPHSIIGFIHLRRGTQLDCITSIQPLEIQRLYVDSNFHGQGVAQQLMQAAIAIAREDGADGLWLCVWEHNPRAIAFYKKLGFVEVGEHEFYLGNDQQRDIVMLSELSGQVSQDTQL